MQSVSHSIPRCVLAQNYIDSVHRNSNNSSDSGYDNLNRSSQSEDGNSDMDERYQDIVLANAPQRSHRREGIAKLNNFHSDMDLAGPVQYSNMDGDMRESQHYTQQQHLQQSHHQYQQQSPYGADRNTLPDYQQQQYHHFQQSEQRHSTHYRQYQSLPCGGDSGASAYQNQSQHRHLHNHGQHGGSNNGHRYHYYSHAEMSRLEAMFPPLHDPIVVAENNQSSTKSIVVDNPLQKQPMAPSTTNSVATKMSRQAHLLPPPILIPKDISLQVQKHHQMKQQQQPQAQEKNTNLTQVQQLPSPSLSVTSPESPSSLAIHLYVHHHHHHQQQQQEPSPPLSATPSSAPLLLLSPLTLPLGTPSLPSPPLPSGAEIKTLTPASSLSSSLPSPPSPTPELISSVSPRPLVPLLPSLTIPNICVEINSNTVSTPFSIISPATPPANATNEIEGLPWFTHPNSLANANVSQQASCPSSESESRIRGAVHQQQQQQKQTRRHRHRHHAHAHPSHPQLSDPVFARHLLSTITPENLSRLYVHAAHHLHSHQPIRRYVLMKMMMTQAEMIQYGRLRAEMPRAPGPSTGAQPKRTGFGSEANTGLSARPKVPSKLGMYVMNIPTTVPPKSFSNGPLKQSFSTSSPMPIEGPEGLVLKSKSMVWTQSLSSLVGFSSSFSQKRTRASLSEPNLYSARRFEELELGGVSRGIDNSNNNHLRTLTRRRMQESEDDGDAEMESGDQYDDEGEDYYNNTDTGSQGDEESTQSYWSWLRRKNNRNRRRTVSRSVDDTNMNQPIYPSFSSAVSSTSTKSASNNKSKHARRRTGTSSSSLIPSVQSSSMHVSRRAPTSLVNKSGSASALSFSEAYGFSGILMLSLFLFFLFLLEGTNQFHNIQSALQSIVL
ncbi:hypothetical protein BGX27_001063 [Mortierella sp. AM989]|nr:hypothetical protein BGX27_001063 [Mortierella sp. AM989]